MRKLLGLNSGRRSGGGIALVATLLASFLLQDNLGKLKRLILVIQCFVPFLIGKFLVTTYLYKGALVEVTLSKRALLVVIIAYSLAIGTLIPSIRKRWRNAETLSADELICPTTIVVIAGFSNAICDTYRYITGDVHHPGEWLIGWQQLRLGQLPYREFIPVSGMFSYVAGFMLDMLGGTVGSSLVNNWFMDAAATAFVGVIVALCSLRIVGSLGSLFLVSLFIVGNDYFRPSLVLPSILILLIPWLRERRWLWICAYALLSLAGGLYYPLFGAATCLACMPVAIKQARDFFVIDWKRCRKSPLFWVSIPLMLAVLVASLPLLSGALKHTIIYSSQTDLADGIAVFGQDVPAFFMPLLTKAPVLRRALYYAFRYVFPMTMVWGFLILGLASLRVGEGNARKSFLSVTFLECIGCMALLMVSYTYTLVRADVGVILSRTSYPVIFGAFLFALVMRVNRENRSNADFVALSFAVSAAILLSRSALISNSAATYTFSIPDTAVETSQAAPINLGTGFVDGSALENFKYYKALTDRLLTYEDDLCFMGLDYQHYVALNIKTCGQTSLGAMKSLASATENIDAVLTYRPVVFKDAGPISQGQYFFWAWLNQRDDYTYIPTYSAYLPNELVRRIESVNGTRLESLDPSAVCDGDSNLGLTPNSLGRSVESLTESGAMKQAHVAGGTSPSVPSYFSDGSKSWRVDLDEAVNGADGDFLHLVFAGQDDGSRRQRAIDSLFDHDIPNGQVLVSVSWEDDGIMHESTVACAMGTGELLVNLGVNSDWLLNDHNAIVVTVSGYDPASDLELSKVEFMRSELATLLEN